MQVLYSLHQNLAVISTSTLLYTVTMVSWPKWSSDCFSCSLQENGLVKIPNVWGLRHDNAVTVSLQRNLDSTSRGASIRQFVLQEAEESGDSLGTWTKCVPQGCPWPLTCRAVACQVPVMDGGQAATLAGVLPQCTQKVLHLLCQDTPVQLWHKTCRSVHQNG